MQCAEGPALELVHSEMGVQCAEGPALELVHSKIGVECAEGTVLELFVVPAYNIPVTLDAF